MADAPGADVRVIRAMRRAFFSVILLASLCAAATASAQQCSFAAAVPANWQRMDTAVATLRLPRDAYTKRSADDDGGGDRYVGDGLDVLVDYGQADSPREPEQGMVSRLLGGAPAFIVSEAHADGAGRIAITWAELGGPRIEASVTIDYADASRHADACRIASGLRLRGDAASLTLLRTGRSAGQRYALLRDAHGEQRRVVVGDYVALQWGKVTRIDDAVVEIAERIADGRGGWSERRRSVTAGAKKPGKAR
jgi:hypothetical protein